MNAVPAHGGIGGDTSGADGSGGAGPSGGSALPAAAARSLSRRRFLRAAGFAAASVPLSSALAACRGGSSANSGNREVRIGYISPQTGSLSEFADAEAYTTKAMQDYFQRGIMVGSQRHPVRIVVRDSQSDAHRAAEAASDLIFKDQVDIVLASASSDTVNPVADQCEVNGVPCITTGAPWESWYYGRGGQQNTPFEWTYHIFWGLDDLVRVYRSMWDSVPGTNKKIGLLFPEDTDGGQLSSRFPNLVPASGYTLANDGKFSYGTMPADPDQPALMAGKDIDILVGMLPPADFHNFWTKASKQIDPKFPKRYFSPKVVTVSKALLFQDDVIGLGSLGGDLGTEVWWSPTHQFKSELTGITAGNLANDFIKTTGKGWAQTLGFTHVLFEVVAKALAGITSIDDKASIVRAIAGVRNYNSIVGEISFGAGGSNSAARNVAKTPLVGGEWRRAQNDSSYELVITNSDNPAIKAASPFKGIQPSDQGGAAAT